MQDPQHLDEEGKFMQKVFILIVTIVLALGVVGTAVAAPQQGVVVGAPTASQGGKIEGIAKDSSLRVLSGVTLQLRKIDQVTSKSDLVDSTRSDASGRFSFTGVVPGNYVIEIVDDKGAVMVVGSPIAVAPSAVITGVVMTGNAAGAVGSSAAGRVGAFFASTAGLVLVGAAGTAAGAVVVANKATAPSATTSK
jgi:hypothetical protein